ncbi:hypothetical protein HNR46_000544 [Haloferula luteola]|uniref:LamG-like jellyroll fold domain-containing protein n=2 Tax=Haloferula luteola TaxID=595692 RepID=A0A840V8N7_9BACT|nr:hypothetical protein [Haloferula luteola]
MACALPATLSAVILAQAGAEEVTLTAADAIGSTSFNTAGNWSSAAAPSAGNDYLVSVQFLRTPADANSYTFAGDSLTLYTGGGFLYKGTGSTGVITVDPLILDGGKLDHASSYTDVFTVDGTVEVPFASSVDARQGQIVILSEITATAQLTLDSTGGNGYAVTFGGPTHLSTDLVVNTAFILADTGSMEFVLNGTNVDNMITGTGSVTLNGTISLDLTNASSAEGDTWSIVDAGALTIGDTFAIDGFTEVDGFWTSASGVYQFNERTGVLSVLTGDSDFDGLPDAWEMEYFGNLDANPGDDADGDYSSNYDEYLAGTDPDDVASFPDVDEDDLMDGWEIANFGNLDQTKEGDADADFNSNYAEMLAGTDPNDYFSYPDVDGDFINDGWELLYFATVEDCDPDEDPDGDLYTNSYEATYETDPTNQFSSPDGEDFDVGDGLPDGWEVFWFGEEGEDLETITAKYTGQDDPDGDGFNNLLEYAAGTNPLDATSFDTMLAYWRFEELGPDEEVPAGGNGEYLYPTSVKDESAYGNPMMAWATYVRPNYSNVIPAATVPGTGESNAGSLYFARNASGQYFVESVFTTPVGQIPDGEGSGVLRSYAFNAMTVEATFRPTVSGQWMVPVAKFGNPVGGQPPFSIKIDTSNKLRAGLVDGSMTAREIIGGTTIEANSWYSAAVTVDATTMTLWLKTPGSTTYQVEGTVAISGAWYVPAEGPLENAWNVGGGQWNGTSTDGFQGQIDEVRISAVVLPQEEFLFFEGGDSSEFDTWAAANITDETQRGASDDPDGDGTSNMAEFLLGLDPMDPSSMFVAMASGEGAITWPAASGLEFSISRSTDLATWTEVATVTADATTGTWTDPAPPEGKAFYKVELAE